MFKYKKYKKKYDELLQEIEKVIDNSNYNDAEKYVILKNIFFSKKIKELLDL